MSDAIDPPADVPEWDDEYVDRVSDRLMAHYDLEKDRTVRSRTFTLYGELRVVSQKHFLHPALSYADHESTEHLFVRRAADGVTVADLEELVALGHALADEWVAADEDHFSTDFTFVVLADAVPEAVGEFVADFRDRTLLKYGYNGHYEVHLVVVAPDREDIVASREADVGKAFELWASEESGEESKGLLRRLLG